MDEESVLTTGERRASEPGENSFETDSSTLAFGPTKKPRLQKAVFEEDFNEGLFLINLKNKLMFLFISLVLIFALYKIFSGAGSKSKKHNRLPSWPVSIQDHEIVDRFGNEFTVALGYSRVSKHYTQGLAYFGGRLIESTGEYSQSNLQSVLLDDQERSATVMNTTNLESVEFGQGCDLLEFPHSDDAAAPTRYNFQLTFKNKLLLRYSFDEPSPKRPLKSEYLIADSGVGLTHRPQDIARLLSSSGTDLVHEVDVLSGRPVPGRVWKISPEKGGASIRLGELEWAQDSLLAVNLNERNELLVIDLDSRVVVRRVEFSHLFAYCDKYDHSYGWPPMSEEKLLSAVAFDAQKSELYVTGRYWPLIFKLRFSKDFFQSKKTNN